MEIETITKLLDAGYSKAEIDALESGAKSAGAGNEGGNDVSPDTAPAEHGEESAAEVKKIETNVDINAAITALTDTVNGLTATVKAMQDANAKGAHTDSPKGTDAIKAAMDSFIEKL